MTSSIFLRVSASPRENKKIVFTRRRGDAERMCGFWE